MLREKLLAMRDEGYAAFQRRLLPTVAPDRIIGVRTPALRNLAKEMRGTQAAQRFLQALPHASFEENQLHAFLLNDICDFDAALMQVEAFLPYIDNWATCDQLRPRAFAREKDKLLLVIDRFMADERPYVIRFGIEMLMCHFMDEDFEERFLKRVAAIRSEEYYVNMMIAWYFATALTRQYDAALPYMEERRLDTWTHNKAIQKAIESLQISAECKAYLRTLKA